MGGRTVEYRIRRRTTFFDGTMLSSRASSMLTRASTDGGKGETRKTKCNRRLQLFLDGNKLDGRDLPVLGQVLSPSVASQTQSRWARRKHGPLRTGKEYARTLLWSRSVAVSRSAEHNGEMRVRGCTTVEGRAAKRGRIGFAPDTTCTPPRITH